MDDSIGTPMIMKVNPDMMPVLAAAVDKDGMDANALSGYVKNDLAPALEVWKEWLLSLRPGSWKKA